MRSETSTLACFGYNNNHEDFFQHKPSILDDLNSFFLTSLKSIPRLCISQLTLKISGNPGPTSSRQLPSHRPLHFNTKHKDIVSLSIIQNLHNNLSLLCSLSQTTPIRAVRITDLLTPAFKRHLTTNIGLPQLLQPSIVTTTPKMCIMKTYETRGPGVMDPPPRRGNYTSHPPAGVMRLPREWRRSDEHVEHHHHR